MPKFSENAVSPKTGDADYRGVIRDPIHGFIAYSDLEYTIMQHQFLRRLHSIKQLGLSNLVFPGATHTRFSHSIGVMYLSGIMAERVSNLALRNSKLCKIIFQKCDTGPINFVKVSRLLGLLHDIGHFPLSHQLETSFQTIITLSGWPSLIEGRIPETLRNEIRKTINNYKYQLADKKLHEIFTLHYIEVLREYLEKNYGGDSSSLIDVVRTVLSGEDSDNPNIDYLGFTPYALKLLKDIISHKVFDADRLDYLERDGEMTGLVYGIIDSDRLVQGLDITLDNELNISLSIHSKSMSSLEDVFDARYKMYKNVYYHHKSLAINIALNKIVEGLFRNWDEITSKEFRKIIDSPARLYDPEYMSNLITSGKFLFTDSDLEYLIVKLSNSKDPTASRWAKSVIDRRDLLPISLVKRPDTLLKVLQKHSQNKDIIELANSVFASILGEADILKEHIVKLIKKELGTRIDASEIVIDLDKKEIYRYNELDVLKQYNSLYLDALAKVGSVVLLYIFVYSDSMKYHAEIYKIRSLLRTKLMQLLEELIENMVKK